MAPTDPKTTDDKPAEQKPEQKPAALGEDDEFEDFPVDGTTHHRRYKVAIEY
jgi:26 proteasome complex subunit DSS1